MMKIIEINQGPKIPYEESGSRVYFGDDEIMVNVAKYQRDWPVHLDICSNADKQLVVGTGEGLYYVAQLDVPEIKYTEQEVLEVTEPEVPTPIPLNMDDVTLTLWSTENPTPVIE